MKNPVSLLQSWVLLIFQDYSNRMWDGSWKISMDIILMKRKLMIFNGSIINGNFHLKKLTRYDMYIFHSVKNNVSLFLSLVCYTNYLNKFLSI